MEYNPPINPARIRRYYSKTLKENKVFLTGHSHLAWPDIVERAQLFPVKLAFTKIDHKWKTIFGEVIPRFQRLVASRAGIDNPNLLANGENTHEMITRFLSCFPWNSKTKIVSTDGEYYSLRRQLQRLEEEGVKVNYISTDDKETFTNRMVAAIKPGTTAVLVSTVLFKDGFVVQNLKSILDKAREVRAFVLLDAYHSFNIRNLEVDKLGKDIFVVGGGYKYASGGEGAVWLKVPEKCSLRPRITGWFSEFALLNRDSLSDKVTYGNDFQRFLGATRDISGMCRQIAVLEFLDKIGLTPRLLERNNLYQTSYLIHLYDSLQIGKFGTSLLSSRDDRKRGPFIAIDVRSLRRAESICSILWERWGVLIDSRGSVIRIGPAPYNTRRELNYAMQNLAKVVEISNKNIYNPPKTRFARRLHG